MPKDEKFLEKRKSYFQKKLETRQLQKQFQEYGRERLGENNPEVEKIFKPRKFFAFTFYSVLFFICTLLLAVVMSLFVHEDNLSYPIFTKNKMLNLFVCVIFFVGGIFLCVGLQQLWQRIQISFVFRTFLLPRIHVEGGYAINSEESAFAKMIEIRKINNPRFGFIAPLSGALFGCSIPFYILCANLLRIFPNNLILSILGFVLMLFWFYGLFYSIISFAIFLSCETNNKAY
ncbi:hypothetical protein OZX57_02960 [Bifidobacterium sp. ESL0682]|uniref:hypothetical protein n=1 Tax=Bifidobacterium sp. ESL0682 TaxID=2983212 RepID=UPI0023F61F7C|nr:hypothetical protein [Bifidobacterium sp. ESL0682]WEV42430.1 hypothetical protein OZX57_02960 [Bifidobacterium sp. ESL0682]